MNLLILTLILIFLPVNINAQNYADSIKYTENFSFNEGIYKNLMDFLSNAPTLENNYLIKENQGTQILIGGALEKEKVYRIDSLGERNKIRKNNIWGKFEDNKLYIYLDGNFHRIIQVGKLCTILYSKNIPYLPSHKISKINNPVKQQILLLDTHTGQVFEFQFCKILKVIHENDLPLLIDFISGDRKLRKIAKNNFDNINLHDNYDFSYCSLRKKKYYYKFIKLINDYNKRNALYFYHTDK